MDIDRNRYLVTNGRVRVQAHVGFGKNRLIVDAAIIRDCRFRDFMYVSTNDLHVIWHTALLFVLFALFY